LKLAVQKSGGIDERLILVVGGKTTRNPGGRFGGGRSGGPIRSFQPPRLLADDVGL
jgi:hypothetical protein